MKHKKSNMPTSNRAISWTTVPTSWIGGVLHNPFTPIHFCVRLLTLYRPLAVWYNPQTRKALIAWLATVLSSERHRFVVDKIESSIRKFQEISEKGAEEGAEPKGGFHLGQLWNLFVMGLVGYFALSIVHQFARVSSRHQIRWPRLAACPCSLGFCDHAKSSHPVAYDPQLCHNDIVTSPSCV
jgi:hypothetical protein